MRNCQRISWCLAVIFFVAIIAGCGEDEITGAGEDEGKTATLGDRVANNNEFAMDLYYELSQSEDGDLVVCPHSISTVFGMAYAGARSETERQIAEVLRFNYPQNGFHSVLNQLNCLLEGREGTSLNIDNGCWVDSVYHYEKEYLDTVSQCYDAEVDSVDFQEHAEEARMLINDWVYENCHINELFPPGSIDDFTYMVLVNTINLYGDWMNQFDPQWSFDGSFTKLEGSQITVRYMLGETYMPFYQGEGFQALEMQFESGNVSMVIILPDGGEFVDFESSLSTQVIDSICGNLEPRNIRMYIPRFSISSDYSLAQTMKDMGLTLPFDPGADFSGMDGVDDGQPWISVLVHKARIWINEYGCSAVAGTGMTLSIGMTPEFVASRPFIYLVRDIETNTILFMGRVMSPVDPGWP